jgi:hypothetical protein
MQYHLSSCANWKLDYVPCRRRDNTGHTKKNGATLKVDKKHFSHPTRAQYTISAAETLEVSLAVSAVRFSCLLGGRGTSCQDGDPAREGFLCAPF